MTGELKKMWVLVAALLLAGCSVQRAASTPAAEPLVRFPEAELKERLQREAGAQATPLTVRRSVKSGQGAEFIVPSGVAYRETGDLYVSDNNAHALHLWQAGSPLADALTVTPAEHQLKFPNTVQVWGGKLYVADGDGIKVLTLDGRFERLIRPYFGIFDFAVTNRGTILASVTIRNPDAEDPLIVELSQTGKMIRELGSRSGAAAGGDDRAGQAFIAVSERVAVVAYKYRPVVELYDLNSGELIRQFKLNHPIFMALESESATAVASTEAKKGRNITPRYIARVKLVGERIILCLHLPVPEVWEVDEEGNVLAEYRADGLPTAIHIFGFDARADGNEWKFAIGVIDPSWDASLYELTTPSN